MSYYQIVSVVDHGFESFDDAVEAAEDLASARGGTFGVVERHRLALEVEATPSVVRLTHPDLQARLDEIDARARTRS